MKKSNAAMIVVILAVFALFLANMMTYDSENASAMQCRNAGGEMSAVITPLGTFEYCDGIYQRMYFVGNACCEGN